MSIYDLLNGTAMRMCMNEAGESGGSSGDGGGADASAADAGADTGGDDAATKNSPDEGSDGNGTAEGDEGDDNADNDKTKENSDTDDEKGEGDDDGDEDDGTEPITVDDFELPEGVEVDEEMMKPFLEIVNNNELSDKERSQELVNLYATKQQEAVEAQYQSWEDTRNSWKTEAKADKEIGGAAFDENLAHAQKALARYGSKELQEFGDQYGWADHPEYLRMLVRVGKTLSEDNSAGNSGRGGDAQTSIENRWYGTDGKN
jgi:hypothetical protein